MVTLPAETRVGEVITLRFTSFGDGCANKDTTEAVVAALDAEVKAFQRTPTQSPSNSACAAVLRLDQHVTALRFMEQDERRCASWGWLSPGTARSS